MNPTKEEWQQEVRKIFSKIKSHQEPYPAIVNGIEIEVFPNVFSPAYFTDSAYYAKVIPEIVGNSSLLEVGVGTGIVSLAAALNGAKITGSDINSSCIANASHNFRKYNIDYELYLSNIFDQIPSNDKYDFILWNHPFNNGENKNEEMLLKAGFDYQYQSLRKYIGEAKEHLNGDGRLLLGTGNFADLKEVELIARSHNYNLKLLRKKEFPLESNGDMLNDYRVYELKKS